MKTLPNEIAGANAGLRAGFVAKQQVVLRLWPGVARLRRWVTEIPSPFL